MGSDSKGLVRRSRPAVVRNETSERVKMHAAANHRYPFDLCPCRYGFDAYSSDYPDHYYRGSVYVVDPKLVGDHVNVKDLQQLLITTSGTTSQEVAAVAPRLAAVQEWKSDHDTAWELGGGFGTFGASISAAGFTLATIGTGTWGFAAAAAASYSFIGAAAWAKWSVPRQLGRVRSQLKRDRDAAVSISGGLATTKLAERVVGLAREIEEEPAWKSEILDGHRVRLDVREERNQVLIQLSRIHRLATVTTDQLQHLDAESSAAEAARLQRDAAGAALVEVAARVDALASYRTNVGRLTRRVAELKATVGVEENHELLSDVLAGSASSAMATDYLRSLSSEAEALDAGIREVIALVRGDVKALER